MQIKISSMADTHAFKSFTRYYFKLALQIVKRIHDGKAVEAVAIETMSCNDLKTECLDLQDDIGELIEYGKLEDGILRTFVDPNRKRIKDKEDHATCEKVLNNFVKGILRKMMNSRFLDSIYGCFSTGKEANVYYGNLSSGKEVAIKIYKVDILDYKNRSRYMEGEFRFRHCNVSKNPHLEAILYIIDVSQSVENDSPQALEFLRQDICNIINFFNKKNIQTPSIKETFDFITDFTLDSAESNSRLEKLMNNISLTDMTDDNVFKQSYIPRHLSQVVDYEKDYEYCLSGNAQNLYYASVTGMTDQLASINNISTSSSCSSSGDSEYNRTVIEQDEFLNIEPTAKLTKEEIKEQRKLNKINVKEEKREKRKTKIPKHIKKLHVSLHSKKKNG
ncbi:hypothetical protein HZS_4583 [Henneguya salminicola]|nr:hypothetical protein HZS_4583 [Henneguya salminicola]